jgi:hypothetical protein
VRIIVVRDQQTRHRLAELLVLGAQRYVAQLSIGEAPWNPGQPRSLPDADIDTTEVPDALIAPLRRASVVLVVCLDLRYVAATDQNLGRIGVVSGASVYPLVWNILLAARSDGYGGNLSTMAVPQESQVETVGNSRFLCGRCGVGSRQADATNHQAAPQGRWRNRNVGAIRRAGVHSR